MFLLANDSLFCYLAKRFIFMRSRGFKHKLATKNLISGLWCKISKRKMTGQKSNLSCQVKMTENDYYYTVKSYNFIWSICLIYMIWERGSGQRSLQNLQSRISLDNSNSSLQHGLRRRVRHLISPHSGCKMSWDHHLALV
jgi:hypothetical protein